MKVVSERMGDRRGWDWIAHVALLLASVSCLAAGAADWPVFSYEKDGMTGNQQLTNAFTKAQAGDTITIHAGTYNLATEEMMFRYASDANGTLYSAAGTCLASSVDNLTVRGDPAASRDDIILSGLGSNAATADGQHAIMRLTGANCTVRHLTFYKGLANTGTLYINGSKVGDTWAYRRGGGLTLSASGVCEDCVFDSCYAGQGACINVGDTVRGCVFTNSNAVANNAGCAVYSVKNIYDSVFARNARGAVRSCSGTISNCLFSANWHNGGTGLFYYQTGSVIDCAFSNNTTVCVYLHGANYMPREITGCTFANNSDATYPSSAGVGGPAACTKPLVGCTFVGPNQVNGFSQKLSKCKFVREAKSSVSVLADCPQVEDSEFFGTFDTSARILEASTTTYVSVVTNCSLYRCHIHDFNIRYGNVITDCPRMENCLVEKTVCWGRSASEEGDASGTFRFTDGRTATVLNCTFVTNQSNGAFVNVGGGTVTFKNTLFFNNNAGGTGYGRQDFNAPDETVYMDHCVYKCNGAMAGAGSQNWYGRSYKPMFMKDRYPDTVQEHPYALHRRSPLVDAGDNGTWTSSDIDIAGAGRLNGPVDIGCYENWVEAPGIQVLFR